MFEEEYGLEQGSSILVASKMDRLMMTTEDDGINQTYSSSAVLLCLLVLCLYDIIVCSQFPKNKHANRGSFIGGA